MSQVRQNFHEECEAAINRQINLELYASYVYMSMAFHFDRDDVSLEGFYKFFKKQSDEERGHAQKLMEYQNTRGGRILLQEIKKPDRDDWGTGLEAMQAALHLEKSINQSLLELHQSASSHSDPQMSDYVEDNFLKEQVESIKEISNYVSNLKRVGAGLGEFLFDKETLQEKSE
ncbi:hypothetical protein ACOMHN_000524 [Nucella lapillus]